MARAAYLSLAILLAATASAQPEHLPGAARAFLESHCIACHRGESPPGGILLDTAEIDWAERGATARWERVHAALEQRVMPPAAVPQPSPDERDGFVAWIEGRLLQYSGVGGTVPRRLNREEYEHTVRDIFGMPGFSLPDAFPADDSHHGFDNVGEGLILSPPLMAQYLAVANSVADTLLPPDTGPAGAESRRHEIGTGGLSMEGGDHAPGGAFRLMSSRNMASAAAWPVRFEALQSGIYRVEVVARSYQTDRMFYRRRTQPFRLALYARAKVGQVYAPFGEIRHLATLQLPADADGPQSFSAEIPLYSGETFGIRWENGPAYSDPPRREYSRTFLADRLSRDRLYYAAMLAYGGGPRGTTQSQVYEATRDLMESGTLDLHDSRLDRMPEVWGGGLSNAPHNWIKAYVHEELYRFGPAVDVVDLSVEGPLRLVEDQEMRERKDRTARFLGTRTPQAGDSDHAREILARFLPRAFRRPVSRERLESYAGLVETHLESAADARLEDALHLAVRRALVSPAFLYRGLSPGRLDAFDLAARLSYFLTSAPPDRQLVQLARNGSLADPEILASETRRLLADARSARFAGSFTGQWLSTRLLAGIMPDPRLLQFGEPDREAMVDETEMLFSEILRENLPLEAFIDPGFSFRNARLNKIYGGSLQGNKMRRVTVPTGGREGGLLSLASVLMATANGVDTHPVLRGVWVLDNILGMPVPEAPPDVPAIAPDTSGASTMRRQLEAHRADPSCARCHDRIDPLGLVLENFDPVGRWREHYPVYSRPPDGSEALSEEFYSTVGHGTLTGPAVESAAVLQDGTRLEDVADLKRYVLDHIDLFARCLTRKLLVYSTGRPLSFGDRQVADAIAAEAVTHRFGFQDLLVEIVLSDAFGTR